MQGKRFNTVLLQVCLLTLTSVAYAASDKVTLCHIPNGDISKAHSILVAPSAVNAHLAMGDLIGDCATGQQGEEEDPANGGHIPVDPSTPVENPPVSGPDAPTGDDDSTVSNPPVTNPPSTGTTPPTSDTDLPPSDTNPPGEVLPPAELPPIIPAPTNTDGIWNGDETDVDCGGQNAPACADGKYCDVDYDCASTLCEQGVCIAVPAQVPPVVNTPESNPSEPSAPDEQAPTNGSDSTVTDGSTTTGGSDSTVPGDSTPTNGGDSTAGDNGATSTDTGSTPPDVSTPPQQGSGGPVVSPTTTGVTGGVTQPVPVQHQNSNTGIQGGGGCDQSNGTPSQTGMLMLLVAVTYVLLRKRNQRAKQ